MDAFDPTALYNKSKVYIDRALKHSKIKESDCFQSHFPHISTALSLNFPPAA
jgi:hypothetical protein